MFFLSEDDCIPAEALLAILMCSVIAMDRRSAVPCSCRQRVRSGEGVACVADNARKMSGARKGDERVGRRPRKAAAPEPVVNGLQPTITETGDAGPDRFTLVCPDRGHRRADGQAVA